MRGRSELGQRSRHRERLFLLGKEEEGAGAARSVMLSDSMLRTYCKWPFLLIGNVSVGADLGKEPLALLRG